MRVLTVTISDSWSGKTVRTLLKHYFMLSSRAISRMSRREQGILINGSRAFTTAILQAGDNLSIDVSDDGLPRNPAPPTAIPIDVVFEDEDLYVINKPAGMTVHASSFAPDTPTVEGALAYRNGACLPFHPVNRLDKGTTGLMIVAKHGYCHDRFRQLLHTNAFIRTYLAICVKTPTPVLGHIDAPIGRVEDSAIAREIRQDGAPAVTDYRVLSQHGSFCLVFLAPQTGRTHQLRVHMASLGCPLAGDWLYGVEDHSLIARPALHSATLQFTHPITGKILSFTSDLPQDMQTLWERN